MIYIILFKSIPAEERPRERLVMYGAKSLSNEELLMIILKTGTKQKSVKELATELLITSGGIQNLKNLNLSQLIKINGIGKVKAIEIEAIIELAKRINKNVTEKEFISFTNPQTIIEYFYEEFKYLKQEVFYCIYLDNKKKYISKKKLFKGTINYSIVHPREIFKEAYLQSASYIICIHNHPSGDPSPSKEDIILTNKIKELGMIHAINLIDHLIIGKDTYYSFYENNYI